MNKQQLLNLRYLCLQLALRPEYTPEEILGLAMGMEHFLLDGMADEASDAAPVEVEPAAD